VSELLLGDLLVDPLDPYALADEAAVLIFGLIHHAAWAGHVPAGKPTAGSMNLLAAMSPGRRPTVKGSCWPWEDRKPEVVSSDEGITVVSGVE